MLGLARHEPAGPQIEERRTLTTDLEILQHDPKLAELVRRLVETHQPARIYLFGSRGRGDGAADSDYDLLMVFDRLQVPAYQMAQQAHSLVWGLGISADILVWSSAEFDRRLSLNASLPATVVRDGLLLHAA